MQPLPAVEDLDVLEDGAPRGGSRRPDAAIEELVTTQVAYHAPESHYLEDGVNGVIAGDADSPASFAQRIATLLADQSTLERLRAGCEDSARIYTAENMASNFADGVVAALKAEPLRKRHRRQRLSG